MTDTDIIPLVHVAMRPREGGDGKHGIMIAVSNDFRAASPVTRKAMIEGCITGLEQYRDTLEAVGYNLPEDAKGTVQ